VVEITFFLRASERRLAWSVSFGLANGNRKAEYKSEKMLMNLN